MLLLFHILNYFYKTDYNGSPIFELEDRLYITATVIKSSRYKCTLQWQDYKKTFFMKNKFSIGDKVNCVIDRTIRQSRNVHISTNYTHFKPISKLRKRN